MKQSRFVRSIPLFVATAVCGVLAAAWMVRSAGAVTSPLPALAVPVKPVAVFILDLSGSMQTCDGGTVVKTHDLTPAASGSGYLFDPATDTTDDGNCGTSSGGNDSTGGADTTFPNRSTTNLGFRINRLEAAKLALSKMLDANRDGAIDSADEQILQVKLGFSAFDTTESTYYALAHINTIGSSFATIWNNAKTLGFDANTPIAPTLAGARAKVIANCYDGKTATLCDLGPGQTDVNGDDIAINKTTPASTCRDYYVILLSDGEPTAGTTKIPSQDPMPVAKALRSMAAAYAGELTDLGIAGHYARVRTMGIGFGADVLQGTGRGELGDGGGSTTCSGGCQARGVFNCLDYWGADAVNQVTDADNDSDATFSTMSTTSSSAPGHTEVTVSATGCDDYNFTVDWSVYPPTGADAYLVSIYGDGYFAANATELAAKFQQIMNAIQAGTYSRSAPAIFNAAGGTTTSEAVYGAYFDILARAFDWRGHLRKYQFDTTQGGYVDCGTTTVSATPKPCWDAGGWYGGTDPRSSGTIKMLYERNWSSRVVLAVNPANLLTGYRTDMSAEMQAHPDADTSLSVRNVVPLVSGYALPLTTAGIGSLSTSGDLYRLVSIMETKDPTHTYKIDGTETVPKPQILDGVGSLMFVAGRPGSTFYDDSKRCGAMTCADTVSSPKLGDSFNSRPTVVSAPTGLVSDADYKNEFLVRTLDSGSGFDQGHYSGNEAIVDAAGSASACIGSPSTCDVAHRRTMVYLAANDGQVHAYDEATGYELWSFIPPGHMQKLDSQRSFRSVYIDSPPIVRDIKFPCERTGTACSASGQDPYEDGKWHTLLMYGQGTGGQFYFALDITNPVKPVFLWEYRKPDKMGLTLARPTAGQIPNSTGYPTKAAPGVALFVTGGYLAAPGVAVMADTDDAAGVARHTHLFSISPFSGQKMADHHGTPFDLPDTATKTPVLNGYIGEPRAVDGDLNGTIGRVYFGDLEGRLWKACNLTETGGFDIHLFFDPALYDLKPDLTDLAVPNPETSTSPFTGITGVTLTAAQISARKTLRGPIFFPPDVTHDQSGNIIVAFGSGNMLDPLAEPNSNKNFIWEIQDDRTDSCAYPVNNPCSTTTSLATYTTNGIAFTRVKRVVELLTGPPLIFKNFLIYPEFDPDVNNNGNVCEGDTESRLNAISAFDCSNPTTTAFKTGAGVGTNTLTYSNTLITGVTLDAKGNAFVMKSTPGGTPPDHPASPGLSTSPAYAGYRQLE